jgi:DNA modification methylase
LIKFFTGNCLEILPRVEAQSVQVCVTSPPYWALRDYGTGVWEGGSHYCEHSNIRRVHHQDEKQFTNTGSSRDKIGRECRSCGARLIDKQLGLEETLEAYIANLVAVFREVWRVLADDGTLWLNLGDVYSTGGSGQNGQNQSLDGGIPHSRKHQPFKDLRPKNLMGIPWRVAFALQADGWILRSDIIWAKPNPMPESVNDRPTKAHEYVFLMSKAERYYYDAEAIKEPANPEHRRPYPKKSRRYDGQGKDSGFTQNAMEYEMRNKRTVWTIPTQPYAEAHFATFPEELPKLCILAGSKPGDIVLDPFAGTGTTGKVALELGRKAILIELNPDYVQLARERTWVTPGMF